MGDSKPGAGHWGWTALLVLLACSVLAAAGGLASQVAAARRPVENVKPELHVVPFPGTPDASPASEIIFSRLKRSDLRSVAVRGSRSGFHSGRLSSLPAQAGMAFAPARAFTPGERVTVSAALNSPRAGTESGDPGATTLKWSFTIAVFHEMTVKHAVRHSADRNSTVPVAHFHSRTDLRPPQVRAGQNPDHRSGDIFITAQIGSYWAGKPIQGGPMILDSRGRLVWFRPVPNLITGDLQKQFYRGRQVLTWWQGRIPPDSGEDVIVDQSYRQVATVGGAEGYHPDLHEFQITPQGTALVVADAPVTANLTSVGGARHGIVLDCVIQELDIRTGRLVWEWHALGHIPLADSYVSPPARSGVYDAFHLNSIQQLPGHRLLISVRNTWSLYEIDERTGHIIWRLGGKHSSFTMEPGTRFEEQHDARLAGSTLTLFDDADPPQEEPQSSAMLLRIDPANMTVSLAARYTHSPPLLSDGAGSTQVLPNGDVFVGWGGQPHFSEYSSSGRQIFDASLPLAMVAYRAYRFPWTGRPTTRPALAVTVSQSKATVYSSWNGATRVAAWRVLAGSTPGHLTAMAQEHRTGFETAIKLQTTPRYAAVRALDASGAVLGTSEIKATP